LSAKRGASKPRRTAGASEFRKIKGKKEGRGEKNWDAAAAQSRKSYTQRLDAGYTERIFRIKEMTIWVLGFGEKGGEGKRDTLRKKKKKRIPFAFFHKLFRTKIMEKFLEGKHFLEERKGEHSLQKRRGAQWTPKPDSTPISGQRITWKFGEWWLSPGRVGKMEGGYEDCFWFLL